MNMLWLYERPAILPNAEWMDQLNVWANCLAHIPGNETVDAIEPHNSEEFAHQQSLLTSIAPETATAATAFRVQDDHIDVTADCSTLNDRQNMVRNIISSHLHSYLGRQSPPQRLMIVHGQGGTGKSAMLNAIAETFIQNSVSSLLAKNAMSGIAASIVRGQTLHTWAALPVRTPQSNKWLTHPGKAIATRREHNIRPALWLTIDEMSMLTTPLLAHLAEVTGKIRSAHSTIPPSTPFSNLNILLLGDLHQLPPIANSKKELYNDAPPDPLSQLGRSLFEQFDIVVQLEEQMRITDPVWDRVLQRVIQSTLSHTQFHE